MVEHVTSKFWFVVPVFKLFLNSLCLRFDSPWEGLLRGPGSGDPAMGTPLIILGSPEDGLRALSLVEA